MRKLLNSISKKEWGFVFFLSLVMIFITTAPLVYGWVIRPSGQIFTGTHFAAPNDWFVYHSYLEQVRQGNFLFKNLFASESHLPVLNIFWLAAGLIAKFSGLSNLIVFNGVRIFLIPIFYFVAYLFIAYLFGDTLKRKISLLLLSFSSGLGVFLIDRIIKYPYNFANGVFNWPLDLWVPESITFLTLYYSGHFIASLILILLIFLLTILFVNNKRLIYSLWAGICALVLFSFHPFHVLSIFSVIGVYFLALGFENKKIIFSLIKHYLVLTLFSLVPIFYYLYLLKVDFVLAQKAAQNLTFTTPLWITLFSYGLLLIFSIMAVYFLFKKLGFKKIIKDKKIFFIIVWVIVQFIVIYFPVNYQRRMTEGLHFPLVILTTIALLVLYNFVKQQKKPVTKFIFSQRYIVLFILVILLILSNLFQLAVDSFIYTDRRETSFAYLDQEVVDAARWLKAVDENKIIFNTASNIINIVPAYSGRKVYVGHGVETPGFGPKQMEVDWFFAKNRPEQIEREFLLKRNIDYIFYSELEKEIGDYTPENKFYLNEVYSNSKVKIYQVL